jgi:hypothetical protein
MRSGVSPGDTGIAESPYVAPHAGRPSGDDYWNATFGAGVTADRIRSTDDAVAFLHRSRQLTPGSAT